MGGRERRSGRDHSMIWMIRMVGERIRIEVGRVASSTSKRVRLANSCSRLIMLCASEDSGVRN